MTSPFYRFVSTILLLSALGIVATVNAGDAVVPDNSVALFNGQNLEGWRTWLRGDNDQDPKKVFSVQNGAIRISGDGLGYLATEKSYRDYRLVVEFRKLA